MKITEFSNSLSDEILAAPEETIALIEVAIEESGMINKTKSQAYKSS